MIPIQTPNQLDTLQSETYVLAVIVALVIVVLSWISAWLVKYSGGDDRSYVTRRVWLIVWTLLGAVGFWLYNYIYVASSIKKPALANQFAHTNLICIAITVLGSLVVSVIIMLIFRRSKFGSMLPRRKER